ncbi:MAG: glycoside hydrolase family 9 protein [Oscillospiraceae bacterium]|nr:glycoside hydrolase family 9 protein [Oscillospiraceae bacterium]
MTTIRADQLGYRPDDPKQSVLPQTASAFELIRISDDTVVFGGNADKPVFCEGSGETVRIAGFSDFTQPGEYRLQAGKEVSYPFIISNNPYGSLRKTVLDFFRLQQCGINLDAGVWSHPACHTDLAAVLDSSGSKTGVVKDVSGGWHDAGDYGRYIVPAAQTAAQLLLAYELAPRPDPDVLDVVWFELEWMLKMQDEASGGVYHKVSCRDFPPLDHMPEREDGELVLCPVSATATADFAATMALASRFYPGRRKVLMEAASRAWQWCLKHPDAPGFCNPPGVKTGEYGDEKSQDERFWAACALFAATGDETIHDYIKKAQLSTGLGWKKMGTYGLVSYLCHARGDAGLAGRMKEALSADAQKLLKQSKADPYGISLGTEYRWGSNMTVANNAMTLLLAGLFDQNAEYRHTALEHMHYLLGKNALGKCYISGFGSNPMQNPHHRPSVAAGKAQPGMVSGGPNGGIHGDAILQKNCQGLPPMMCYADHAGSCASNEVAVYWNSPVYFILAFLDL